MMIASEIREDSSSSPRDLVILGVKVKLHNLGVANQTLDLSLECAPPDKNGLEKVTQFCAGERPEPVCYTRQVRI